MAKAGKLTEAGKEDQQLIVTHYPVVGTEDEVIRHSVYSAVARVYTGNMRCISNKFQLLNGHDAFFDSFNVGLGSSCDAKHSFSVLMKIGNPEFFQNFNNSIAAFYLIRSK
ncbi:hypothetical protein OCU04_003231 [Sclerotinia nivalis]|uniref:Uncharacterized protein n=1 Tax=Sclerotinia nivalis TaxID=352851 RepID=A0A9X0DL56_9HELO|nr:hypothetical protein OCU04_003231 [Sclerotinia nivalis]